MSMRRFISKLRNRAVLCPVLVFVALCMPLSAMSHESEPKDTSVVVTSNVKPNRYDRRVHRYRQRWEGLIPTHLKMQYAGNMGFLSVGFGWDYGKRNQWETDLLLGYLPQYDSKRPKMTFTVKQNYIPWSRRIGKDYFDFEPLTCGLYLNTVPGDEFWTNEPDRYPKGYYGFSSRVRIHVFVGQRLTFNIPQAHRYFAKQLTLFYELGTADLYVISAFTNKYLRPRDYLSLSFGLKMQMF